MNLTNSLFYNFVQHTLNQWFSPTCAPRCPKGIVVKKTKHFYFILTQIQHRNPPSAVILTLNFAQVRKIQVLKI